MLYHCGLRPQEAIALSWGDLDFESRLITITKAVESGTKNIKTTKTKSGIRSVPIPDDFYGRLFAVQKNAAELVFPAGDGKQAGKDACQRWWKALRRAMNIEMGAKVYRNKLLDEPLAADFTAYCLRHTYCTNLQRAGVPLNVAKYLMGHSDIKMTANIYGHQTSDQTENARMLIDNYNKAGSEAGSKDG